MSLLVVMDTPLTDPNLVANAYASSEDADFPASNVYDLERRKKAWRSAGCFEIPSGSNTIVFQESAGVNLTATVVVDDYASDALFFAAVKLALEDAGVGTYTVSRDTVTGRIKIVQSVAGGATVFRLMWTGATGLGGLMGFDTSADDTGATTYTADLLKIHTSEWLKWDLGIPSNPTCFAAFGDKNAALPFSPNATLKLQANQTDNWSAPAVDLTITYRENVLGYINTDGLAGAGIAGYRYWRLYVVDSANPNLYVTLGALYLGPHVVTTRGCPEYPLEISAEDYTLVGLTDGGQDFAGKRAQTDLPSLSWAKLDNASKEALEAVWLSYGLHSNFIVGLDINGVFSSDPFQQVRLVKFAQKPTQRLQSAANWSYSWSLKEAL